MVTILGSLLGFLGSLAPDVIQLFRQRADNKQHLELLRLQADLQQRGHNHQIELAHTKADITEGANLYKTYKTDIRWVDALNGTVRPVLAYAFFSLYASVKIAILVTTDGGFALALANIWTIEDQAIFAGIISFYYGQRAMQKIRMGK